MSEPNRKAFLLKKFLVLSVLFPLLALVGAELVCRVVVGTPDAGDRIFETVEGGARLRVRAPFRSSFHPLEFQAKKATGSIRILCLGGSSTFGFPLGSEAAFPHWLEALLEKFHPECKAEVLNLGAMSYGSQRISAALPEYLSLSPDVILIYSGHNEFVERTHNRPAGGKSRSILDSLRLLQVLRQGVAQQKPRPAMAFEVYRETVHLKDAAERDEVVKQFRENYAAILRKCKEEGASVVAATMPSNLLDWRPDGARRFEKGRENQWSKHFEEGGRLFISGKFKAALKELNGASKIDPTHALLQYQIGRCFYELKRFVEAKTALTNARDRDASPQRAFTSINEAIQAAARETGTPLVDLVEVFEKASDNGIVGSRLIEDYVHPTVEGHRLIAAEFYRALPPIGGFDGSKKKGPKEVREFLASLGKSDTGTNAAFFYNLGLKFINQGNWAKVVETNRRAVKIDSYHALAYNNLGRGLQELGRLDEAMDCYQKARQLRADITGIHLNLGSVYQARKDSEKAIDAFREAIKLRPGNARAHYSLAATLADKGQMEDAIRHYRKAIKFDPNLFEAHANLGLAYALTGRNKDAQEAWTRALEIRPGDPVVEEWMGKLRNE